MDGNQGMKKKKKHGVTTAEPILETPNDEKETQESKTGTEMETTVSKTEDTGTEKEAVLKENHMSEITQADSIRSNTSQEESIESEILAVNTHTETDTEGVVMKKKRKIGWLLGGILLAVMLLSYFGTAIYFQTHFLPNTIINSLNCSYKDAATVIGMLQAQGLKYQLEVTDREGNVIGIVTASDADLLIDVTDAVSELMNSQNVLGWILAFGDTYNAELNYEVEFDTDKVHKQVSGWHALQKQNMTAPENAYVGDYSARKKAYEIVPETEGCQLDIDKTMEAVATAILAQEETLNLGDAGCYLTAEITRDNESLIKKLATLNTWVGTVITYDWNGTEVVLDGDTIQEWVMDVNGRYSLNEEAVAEFVAVHAKENDTYGKKRKFTTTLGEELTLPSGAYGWKTDRAEETKELLKLIEAGAVTARVPVFSMMGAKKGSDDIGSSYVEIDLTNQHLYLYENGSIVLESDFVSGNMSKGYVTPGGVFGLTYKTRNAVLRGEDYETPVKYWMPFNGNIGMHDASWRSSFGGDIYQTSGSHGCINLPPSKAAEIYEYVSTGFPVICYYY